MANLGTGSSRDCGLRFRSDMHSPPGSGRTWRPRGLGPSAIYLLPLLLAITACSTTPVLQCPAIVPYTPGQQAEAADEIMALPAGSILEQMMEDYAEIRARLRECAP
jgi:hypothetical protein